MQDERAPSSFAPVATVAPLIVGFVSVASAAMWMTTMNDQGGAGIVMWGVGLPGIGATCAAHFFGRRASGAGWACLFGASLVQGIIAISIAKDLGAIAAVIASLMVYLFAAPPLIMASALARRRERDTGDSMLLWGGVWAAAFHALVVVLTWAHFELAAHWIAIVSCVVSIVAVLVGIARASNRRRFVTLAAAGKVPGYRVRVHPSLAELRELPALFEIGRVPRGVLERTRVTMDGRAYRGGIVGDPIALVPLA